MIDDNDNLGSNNDDTDHDKHYYNDYDDILISVTIRGWR